ncbi:MAG: tRNA lysidine(34) synthetase TilS [Pseudomonadota bacterium]|nr:tRNA lysidine(34) synthetase TilS [Pseudomonadota bacterium]
MHRPGRVRPPLRRGRDRGPAHPRRRSAHPLRLSGPESGLSPAGPAWLDRVRERLTARLEAHADRPLALALSGGGDSIALLAVAADWARAHGRPLLALTLDHGLDPDSPRWTVFARDAAHAAGADWRGLTWLGPKPAAGLPAAARAARHRLIADAARAAGARVVLFAHTAGDVAEADWMRAEGSTLGHLRDWSPSPAWPQGRGLMLLRPMLDVGREELREWLKGQGLGWIEDPANDDPKYARSRARAFLLPMGGDGSHCDPSTGGAEPRRMRVDGSSGEAAPGQPPLTLSRKDDGRAAVRSSPLPMGEGTLELGRDVDAHTLAAALVCAGGGDRPPRGDRLQRLLSRLRSGETFTAALCGARIEASPDQVLVTREAGEFARRPLAPLPLPPGEETVWDGRWALTAAGPGWTVCPAAGLMAKLSKADRVRLDGLPPAVRGGVPVLIRNDATAPVLAGDDVRTRSLVEERLALALDRMTHETQLKSRAHGATLRNPLFSDADIIE